MDNNLEKIMPFLKINHILCLSTCKHNATSTCTLFYSYIKSINSFIVASDIKTQHIQNILINNEISGAIFLQTKTVGKIQGVQFKGIMTKGENKNKEYFKKFPYALIMNPTLWNIKITYLKMTDNRLGFGKKLIWKQNF